LYLIAIALDGVAADGHFRRLAMENDNTEPEYPWMDEIFENSARPVARNIYQYLPLDKLEVMILSRVPSSANYHEIFPSYVQKLKATYSEATIAQLEALAPLTEDNLYDFVLKIQKMRSRNVGDLAARASGGGLALPALAKMVLTHRIRKMIETISSCFQDYKSELDVEDDGSIEETFVQVRDVLTQSDEIPARRMRSFVLLYFLDRRGTVSITYDSELKSTRMTGRGPLEYVSWMPGPHHQPMRTQPFASMSEMCDAAANLWSQFKQEYIHTPAGMDDLFASKSLQQGDDMDKSIDDLVSRLMRKMGGSMRKW